MPYFNTDFVFFKWKVNTAMLIPSQQITRAAYTSIIKLNVFLIFSESFKKINYIILLLVLFNFGNKKSILAFFSFFRVGYITKKFRKLETQTDVTFSGVILRTI